MNRIKNIVPLPGISELEDIARGLVRRLKELKYEDEKQASLGARLTRLIDCAKQLDDVIELKIELGKIQGRFEAAVKSSSRMGILLAQRKLGLWEELDVKLNQIIETTTLRALATDWKMGGEQASDHSKLRDYQPGRAPQAALAERCL